MPLETEHPEYTEYKPKWQRILDCLAGSDAVKGGGYVPAPEAYLADADKRRGQRRLAAYIERGVFSNATDRTASALVGAVFRKEPDYEIPERLKPRIDNINGAGDTIFTFANHVVHHVITIGRFGLFIDWPEEGEDKIPFMSGYDALSIRNWRTRDVGGRPKLDQVILYEEKTVPANDGFGSVIEPQYRVLELAEDGFYIQRLFTRRTEDAKRAAPRRRANTVTELEANWIERVIESKPNKGQRIDYIPFQFVSPHSLRENVSKPPFLDLADENLAHFRGSVALEHGRYYTAHGTPYITGHAKPGNPDNGESEEDTWDYGPDTIWFIPEPEAKVGMLQFSSDGLSYLENGQKEKRETMAYLGARLFEGQRAGVEAAETHRIRQSSEQGTLAGTANTVSMAFEWCLDKMAEWSRAPSKCTFRLNTDFYDEEMDSALLQTVMGALQAGHYPPSAWFWFLKKGEMLPPEMTSEDAQKELETMGPTITARNLPLPDEEEGTPMETNVSANPGGDDRDQEGGRSGDKAAAGGKTRSTASTGAPRRS